MAVYEKVQSKFSLSTTKKISYRQPLQNYFWISQNGVLLIFLFSRSKAFDVNIVIIANFV